MILSQPEIRAEVEKGQIRFDPPLEERQWHEASVDLIRFRPRSINIYKT
jgi:hypothetical protein